MLNKSRRQKGLTSPSDWSVASSSSSSTTTTTTTTTEDDDSSNRIASTTTATAHSRENQAGFPFSRRLVSPKSSNNTPNNRMDSNDKSAFTFGVSDSREGFRFGQSSSHRTPAPSTWQGPAFGTATPFTASLSPSVRHQESPFGHGFQSTYFGQAAQSPWGSGGDARGGFATTSASTPTAAASTSTQQGSWSFRQTTLPSPAAVTTAPTKRGFTTSSQANVCTPAANEPTHNQVGCDSCGRNPIKGVRYRCAMCPNFDLCQDCIEQKEQNGQNDKRATSNPVHDPTHLFFRIHEPNTNISNYPIVANRSLIQHTGITCSGCAMKDPQGALYKCQVCMNCNLCEACEARGYHNPEHPRTKLMKPSVESLELAKCRAEIAELKIQLEKKAFDDKTDSKDG